MSLKHIFICDVCGRKAPAKFNGEHYLPPVDWRQLYCNNQASTIDFHFCGKCVPMKREEIKKKPMTRREKREALKRRINGSKAV